MGKHSETTGKDDKGKPVKSRLRVPKGLKSKETTREDWEKRNNNLPVVISKKNV